MGTVFYTNRDIGSTQSALPVLRSLRESGHTVITAASELSPTKHLLSEAGLAPIELAEYPRFDDIQACTEMSLLLSTIAPDCVLTGVSATNDDGSEKTAIMEATRQRIPVVSFIESWPHGWLDQYGARDIPIYRQVTKMCAIDRLAHEYLREAGFTRGQLVITGNPYDDELMAALDHREEYRSDVRRHFGIKKDAFVVTWMTGAELDNPADVHPLAREWYGQKEAYVLGYFLYCMQLVKNQCRKDIEVIVRVEPNFSGETVQRLIVEYCPSAHFDKVGHAGKPKPHLASDLVIGVKTPMLDQAALLGMPTISFMPSIRDGKKIITPPLVNELGIVLGIYYYHALHELFNRLIDNPYQTLSLIKSQQQQVTPAKDATANMAAVIAQFFK